MSIYPVKLSEWFPIGDDHYEAASGMVSCTRCLICDRRVKYKKAIGHHSIPWGHGDIWCSWKCCDSDKKTKKPDKRRLRRLKKRFNFKESINVAI